MHRRFFFSCFTVLAVSVLMIFGLVTLRRTEVAKAQAVEKEGESQGALTVLDPTGKARAACPLRQTQVKVQITGFLSRVNVTQEFENPFKETIEAVYTFPLPENAAVDDMTMIVGERTVRGKILRREEAQAVYDTAKSRGQVASLLDQERPNVFTQSVANIRPGEQIKISISYVETLKYENGTYEFVFPMVVGRRYIPGNKTSAKGSGASNGTDRVPDASRITPALVPPGMRVGHDVSLDINIDAGVAIESIKSKSHEVDVSQDDVRYAQIKLKNNAVIPNKDFVLRYDVAGNTIQDALLTHRSAKGGFFTLILQPPDRVPAEDVTPKELVFVLDTSGSMSGFPIEKAKETMKLAIDNLYPADTFNLITFAGETRILFDQPVPATPENLRKAQAFLNDTTGAGGTEMMKAIKAALDPSDSQKHVRIVCFMTDAEVGNDMEIISEVQKHPNARVFAFGIGSSVNRFLLDKMAEQGRGEVEYVALSDDGSAAARRFHERVRSPLLTDISIEWNGLPVADVYPQRIPDLFSAKPVALSGRYTGAANGTLRLKGKLAGRDFVREVQVNFPESQEQHDVLSSLWARRRIDDLMNQDYYGAQQGAMKPELRETITNLGIEHRLMSQFTSFVAVEEMIVTEGGQPRRIEVPVEVPEGVDREAVSGHPATPNRFGYFSAGRSSVQVVNRSSAGKTVSSGGLSARSRGPSGSGRGGGGVGASAAPPPNMSATVTITAGTGFALLAEDQKRQELLTKFHPAVLRVIERINKKETTASAEEATFIRNGKAEIQIRLNEKNAEAMAKLKGLGFELVLEPKSARMVIGRIPIENLQKLAELKFIRYVTPQTLSN